MKTPKVSVITALHNKGAYVAETIQSVLAQTMPDWEMIVVENGSTDNGPETVREFSDDRIQLIDSPRQGPGAARNFGLAQATGDWILFLDADDLIEPDFLSSRLTLAAQNPNTNLLAGCWDEFPDGQTPRIRHYPTAINQPAEVLERSAIAFAPWALHSAMIRRSRLAPDLYWPEALDGFPSEDTAFWFPVIRGAKIAWTERSGALYRIQTANSRNEIQDIEKWVRAVAMVIQHNIEFLARKGHAPDARQCANIARVFESNYRLALKKNSRLPAKLALEQASIWAAKSGSSSWSMMGRRILGVRLFNLIRYGVI
jgi:glycosyltransferase involved in cell wall biosynthesis